MKKFLVFLLLLWGGVFSAFAQINVRGTVENETDGPLVGVYVIQKGTDNAAVTDINGAFSINVPQGAVLEVSYLGYLTKEVTVQNAGPLQIFLETDVNMLEETVVIGYGVVRKVDLAGSVAVVDNKSFQDQPITQVADALQGRVAGVQVTSDGIPGGSVKIRIRGANSINKSNEPLYVVDGMVRETGLDGINPEDIQSIQVLKDASSTAIYGSRGANGVVLVTSKTGTKGSSSIVFDASAGISTATRLPEVAGTQEYAQNLVNYNGIASSELTNYLNGSDPGIDWADEVFRSGSFQNYKLAFNKGAESMQSYFSVNFLDHNGLIQNSNYKRYSARANVKASMTKWLDLSVDINASRGVSKGASGFDVSGTNPFWLVYNYSPTMSMYDEGGNYNWDPYGNINENPKGTIEARESERRSDVLNAHADIKFTILPGLTFTTSNGVDYYNYTGYSFSPSSVTRNGAGSSSMSNSNTQRMLLQSTNNLTYVKDWNSKHFLTATAVWEATKSETRYMSISGSNLQAEEVKWWDIQNANTRDASNSYSSWSLLSAVARVMYNYDNRYLLTATFRADGSSRFSNHKWGYFPSVAAAWTISNEEFLKDSDNISNLKLRASFGVVGNQDIDPYSTLGLMSATTSYFSSTNAVTGYTASTLATPDLRWEKTNQFDLGVDLGLFDNRLDITIDYFYKKTTDALLETSLANYLGGNSYYENAGEVMNTGFDFGLSARIIETRDWGWTSSLTGSFLKNKVLALDAGEPIIYGGSTIASVITDATIITEGEAIGTLYGYEWAGIDSEGYDTYYAADGSVTRSPSATDRVVLGQAMPKFTLGWNNTVTWKNLSLNAFFNAAFGAKRINALAYAMNSPISNSRGITAAGYAEKIGDTMPDPTVTNNFYVGNSSKWVESANYLRCENLSVSYDLRKEVAKFAAIRFSASVQNAFTISGYSGMNPAGFPFSSEGDRSNGVDAGTMPCPRTYSLGVRFTF